MGGGGGGVCRQVMCVIWVPSISPNSWMRRGSSRWWWWLGWRLWCLWCFVCCLTLLCFSPLSLARSQEARLRVVTRLATQLLDAVIDITTFPVDRVESTAKNNRWVVVIVAVGVCS